MLSPTLPNRGTELTGRLDGPAAAQTWQNGAGQHGQTHLVQKATFTGLSLDVPTLGQCVGIQELGGKAAQISPLTWVC